MGSGTCEVPLIITCYLTMYKTADLHGILLADMKRFGEKIRKERAIKYKW